VFFCAERIITGSASLSAASALLRSPAEIASSTLRTKLRNSERRPLLISVRRAILRVALRAELVLAMPLARFQGAPCSPIIVVRIDVIRIDEKQAAARRSP